MSLAFVVAGLCGAATAAAQSDDYYSENHGYRYGRTPPARVIYEDMSDAAIDDRVHFALERALGAKADAVSVRVIDGTVYLSGWVPTESERRMAHDAVYAVDGVRGLRIGNLYARTYYYDRY